MVIVGFAPKRVSHTRTMPFSSLTSTPSLAAKSGTPRKSAVALGGCYFGCRSRLCGAAAETYREALAPALAARLEASYAALRELRYE